MMGSCCLACKTYVIHDAKTQLMVDMSDDDDDSFLGGDDEYINSHSQAQIFTIQCDGRFPT